LIWFLLCLLGFFAGAFSGLIGIGGGIIIVPALVYGFGMSQHQAQGTTLTLLVPPIGLLAAWTYYCQGYVDLRMAGLICLGFLLGSVLGAKLAIRLPDTFIRRIFSVILILVGLRMWFSS
jgi:uncharacterized protein